MALTTTASEPVVPPSPPALMPSGLVGESTSAISVLNDGKMYRAGDTLRQPRFAELRERVWSTLMSEAKQAEFHLER